jgi:hypothetical protein
MSQTPASMPNIRRETVTINQRIVKLKIRCFIEIKELR